MDKYIDKIIDKISQYEFVNNIIPGVLFIHMNKVFWEINLLRGDLFNNIILYYFCGLVISRIGSIIVEPIFRKIGYVRYSEYSEYIKACRKDEHIKTMSTTNNMYRTLIATLLCVILSKFYIEIVNFLDITYVVSRMIILVELLVLFCFSYQKQVKMITDRIKLINNMQ